MRPATAAPRPRAFTLVELLVVIVVIAMLMALLMPAVNAAREAGRRTMCVNNQFQMAFATIRYNEANRALPGWRNSLAFSTGTSGTSGTRFASWPVMILPNMERNDIYRTWTTAASPSTPYVSFFVCPSTPPDSLQNPTLAYVGNAGVGSNSATGRATGVLLDLTGTGSMSTRISLDDVANGDGNASTLLYSEECGQRVTTSGSWNAPGVTSGNGAVSWASSTPVFGLVSSSPPTKIINSGSFNQSASSAANMPNSNHPGGAVVSYCDGHTGFLKDSLQGRVYAQLMSWNHTLASGSGGTVYVAWTGTYAVLNPADYE